MQRDGVMTVRPVGSDWSDHDLSLDPEDLYLHQGEPALGG